MCLAERVTEISRLSEVVPVLVGAVLNVVAVIVVRIASRTLVSLWPAIITEMVQVFLVMEQQLSQDTAMFRCVNDFNPNTPELNHWPWKSMHHVL